MQLRPWGSSHPAQRSPGRPGYYGNKCAYSRLARDGTRTPSGVTVPRNTLREFIDIHQPSSYNNNEPTDYD